MLGSVDQEFISLKQRYLEDIIVRCHRPSDFTGLFFQIPVVRQIGMRWSLHLTNQKFMLPEFSDLYITLIENASVVGLDIERIEPPTDGGYIAMHCFVPELFPETETEKLIKLTNECIYASIITFCSENKNQLESANQVKQLMLRNPSGSIALKSAKSRNFTAILGIDPSGVHPAGGLFSLKLINTHSGDTQERKLFDFENYAFAQTLFNKIKISDGLVKFESSKYWKNSFDNMPSDIIISIADFFRCNDPCDWFKSDITWLSKRLLTPVKEPVL